MAVRAGILLLISLCIWIRTSGSCTVSCSTDYKTLLNCSCSGLQPPEPLQLQVYCSWTEMNLMLNASCQVSVQQPFCVMYPDIMEDIADVETECSAIAVRVRDRTATTKDSSKWQLREAVRPWPPFDVRVEMTEQSYNITWDNKKPLDCLTFQVRVRNCLSAEKPPMFLQRTESFVQLEQRTQSFVQLEQSSLAPGVRHRVDVKAMLCPGSLYEGPWSEWSASTSWTTEAAPASVVQLHISAGTKHYYWLFTLLILMILIALGFPKVMFCQKRFKMTYVPNPGEFFKPLYDSYQGNFKAWVKPAFPEHNSLMNAATDTTLDHLNQSSPSADSSLSHNPILNVSLVSMSTVTLASYCSMTSSCPREASSDSCEKRPPLNLSTINIVQDLNEEELSGNDYPLMDLDTIDSGFGECSSPPATGQLLCQDFEADSGPDTQQFCELHSNYVKQWTMGQSADDCLQLDLQKDM